MFMSWWEMHKVNEQISKDRMVWLKVVRHSPENQDKEKPRHLAFVINKPYQMPPDS
jgi:hypothetical protein